MGPKSLSREDTLAYLVSLGPAACLGSLHVGLESQGTTRNAKAPLVAWPSNDRTRQRTL
jgi:hypothetical protein